MQIWLELVVVLLLVLLNAFLAASEASLIAVSKAKMKAFAEGGNRAARRVLHLIETPARFLATVQIGITVAGFFAAAVGAVTLSETVEGWIDDLPIPFVEDHASAVSVVLITLVLAFISIVVGELVPKTLAVSRSDTIAMKVSGPITILAKVLRPGIYVLELTTNVILKLFRSDQRVHLPTVSEAELLAMIETAYDEGVVDAEEAGLVEDALEFGDIQVRSVMVPRVDVAGIESDTTLGEAVKLFFKTGFSRLPVYRDTPDVILGILHIKDVFRLLFDNPKATSLRSAELVRPAYVVPETRPIDELLKDLKDQRTHMAIVADEYGGMAGVVTLEDLIEELVGDIADEFDPGYEPLRSSETGGYETDGRLSLLDLLDTVDVHKDVLNDIEAESVGGLISDRLERIPEVGDIVDVGPLRFEVMTMDGHRVSTVQVDRLSDDEIAAAAETESD